MKETLGKEFYESADKAITISRPETVEQAAEKYANIHMEKFDLVSSDKLPYFHNDRNKIEESFESGAKWQQEQEQDNTANEILDYILTNDDGVGIALGYNSREMIEQYFKRINYGKSK